MLEDRDEFPKVTLYWENMVKHFNTTFVGGQHTAHC